MGEFILHQEESSVTGTWRMPAAEWNGTLTGTIGGDGVYTGRLTLNAPMLSAEIPSCSESVDIYYGRLDPTETWLTLVAFFPRCLSAHPITFELDRRCRLTDIVTLACDVPPPPLPPPGTPAFMLGGQVLNEKLQPLSGAVVEVMDGPNKGVRAISSSTGEYALGEIVQGRWIVKASKVGYLATSRLIAVFGDTTMRFALIPCSSTVPCFE